MPAWRPGTHALPQPPLALFALALPLLAACAAPGLAPVQDARPPMIRIVQPADRAHAEGNALLVEVEYADEDSGISTLSFRALLNDQEYSSSFDHHSRGASGRIRLPESLPPGEARLRVEVADRAGNVGRAEVSFLNPGRGWVTIAAVIRAPAGAVVSLAPSPDGTALAAGFSDGTIRLWQLAGPEGREVAVVKGHRGAVTALAFSPDGKHLASGGDDRAIRVWDLTGSRAREQGTLRGHGLRVTALAFAPGGRSVASGSGDRTVRLWEVGGAEAKLRAMLRGHSRVVGALAFAPDGRTLASGGAEGEIRLWTMGGGEPKERAVLRGHTLAVSALAFAPDSRALASGSRDRTLRLWDVAVAQAKQRTVLGENLDPVQALAFTARGASLIAAGGDRIVRWDALSAKRLDEAALPAFAKSIAANAAASRLASKHDNGLVYVFNIAAGSR